MVVSVASCFFLAIISIASPGFTRYLGALLDVSYGVLALILLASLSIAVSLDPTFSTLSENAFASEFLIFR
jgi:hypothetical protein